jgi:hypothetical protein
VFYVALNVIQLIYSSINVRKQNILIEACLLAICLVALCRYVFCQLHVMSLCVLSVTCDVVTYYVLYLFCRYKQEVLNYKIAARPERRRQFEKELTSQMEVALNILTACLGISELKEQVTGQLLFYFLSILLSLPMLFILSFAKLLWSYGGSFMLTFLSGS